MKPLVYDQTTGLAKIVANGSTVSLPVSAFVLGDVTSEVDGSLVWSTVLNNFMVAKGGVWALPISQTMFPLLNSSPEGVIPASPGTVFSSSDGFLWIKSSGSGNTGWVASATTVPAASDLTLGKILVYTLNQDTGGL